MKRCISRVKFNTIEHSKLSCDTDVSGLNIKVFEPLAHRASASPVSLARMQNLLARDISDIQIIKQNDTPEIQIANLKYFHLPHRASGSQVLLAPPHFLLAPGKGAMLNVEPCVSNLKHSSALERFRMSPQTLGVETVRHAKPNKLVHERKCKNCYSDEIDSQGSLPRPMQWAIGFSKVKVAP